MQDNFPPLSDAQIKALIAEYLDGQDMDPGKTARLQQILANYPEYMEEFTRQQEAKSALSHLAHQAQAPVEETGGSLWGQIARQLNADQQAEIQSYDMEFISAYYDGEIPGEDPELTAFEAQLFRNDEANRMLADVGEISELVRNFGYRLEESCTVDITAAVMARYQAEVSGEAQPALEDFEDTGLDPTLEMLSALYDQELSARETIEWNGRVESSNEYREVLAGFNELSGQIQRVSEQIQAQAPDLLPVISPQLPGIIAENKAQRKVLPLQKRVAIPVAAAAVLLLLFNVNTFMPQAPQPADMLVATEQESAPVPYEIAAVPMAQQAANVHPAMFEGAPVADAEPMTSGEDRRMAATPAMAPSYAKAHRDQALEEIPSAEAYLFETLESRVSADDELPLVLSDDMF